MGLFGGGGLFGQSDESGIGINSNRNNDLDICLVLKGSDQALVTATFTEITFPTDVFVTNPAMRAGSTSRVTIQKDRVYLCV